MNKLLTFGLFLAVTLGFVGCASDKKSSNSDNPPISHPIFDEIDNPIEDPGREAVIKEDGTILVDNEEWGRVDGSGFVYMKGPDGEEKVVGSIYKHSDGTGDYWVFSPNEGGGYFFHRDENGKVTVNWERSIIDDGWGMSPVPDTHKMTPEAKARLKAKIMSKEAKTIKGNVKFNK